MAYDKVTKIDAIAKRKPYTREHNGLQSEHHSAGRVVVPVAFNRDHGAQLSVTIGKSGRMRRDTRHGCGAIVTNFAARTSARTR